jgi:hypothetical protein
MKRDDIVTTIQTAKVKAGFGNTVDEAMKIKLLDGILKRILDGQDRYQILTWLNRELIKAGMDKKHVIDYCWNLVERDIP